MSHQTSLVPSGLLARVVLLLVLMAGVFWLVRTASVGMKLGPYTDIHRQWVVCQYVKLGLNPYDIALRILSETFGPATGPVRVKLGETRIWAVAAGYNEKSTAQLPEHLPPPEATYPPSTLLLLVGIIGFLPESFLFPFTLVLNIALMLLFCRLASDWMSEHGIKPWPLLAMVAVMLIWPPFQSLIETGQFALIVACCLFFYLRTPADRPFLGGIWLALMLIKPSMAILFLLIPFLEGRWLPIIWAGVLHIAAILFFSLWYQVAPWVLLEQWLGACRYLLQGAYTLQEVWNRLQIENTIWFSIIVLSFFFGTMVWLWIFRRAEMPVKISFLCFANLAWTYHERADFVLFLLPLMLVAALYAGRHHQPPDRMRLMRWLATLTAIGIAFVTKVYGSDEAWTHILRWMGRIAIAISFVWSALLVMRADRNFKRTHVPAFS